jgi:hypothetical protein
METVSIHPAWHLGWDRPGPGTRIMMPASLAPREPVRFTASPAIHSARLSPEPWPATEGRPGSVSPGATRGTASR